MGKILTGVVVNHTYEETEKYLPVERVLENLRLYTEAVGRKPHYVSVYNEHGEGLTFPRVMCEALADAGHTPVLILWPDEVPDWSGVPSPAHSLNNLATNASDPIWQALGQQIRSYLDTGRKLVVAADEPQGFAWAHPSQGAGANDTLDGKPWPRGPAQFIRMWRRMHGNLKGLCPELPLMLRFAPGWGDDDPATNPDNWWRLAKWWWPGKEHVDIVGMNALSYGVLKDGAVLWPSTPTGEESYRQAVNELLTLPGAEALPWSIGFAGSEHPDQPNYKTQFLTDLLTACERDPHFGWVDAWCDDSYARDVAVWEHPQTAAAIRECYARPRFDPNVPEPEPGPAVVAKPWLEPGWHTFPVLVGEDRQAQSVKLAGVPSQCNVLCLWPSGAVKLALLTTRIETAGNYGVEVGSGSILDKPFVPTFSSMPEVKLVVTIGRRKWTRSGIPEGGDQWLTGALMQEMRYTGPLRDVVTGAPHPYLSMLADVRQYFDGHWVFDLVLENCLIWRPSVPLTVEFFVNGQLTTKESVKYRHRERSRQRFKGYITRDGGYWTPPDAYLDWTEAWRIGALPKWDAGVGQEVIGGGGDHRLMGTGELDPLMNNHGGRSEIAPYPDWTARYVTHLDPEQLAVVLAHGDISGHWPIHLRDEDGVTRTNIDDHPDFFQQQGHPIGGLVPDVAHQPSLAYVPWLVTGERFYADEMCDWADFTLWSQQVEARQGSTGLLLGEQTRGIAWGLRNLADAAAWLPDVYPDKARYTDKVRNNMVAMDTYTVNAVGPLGVAWLGEKPSTYHGLYDNPAFDPEGQYLWVSMFMSNYLAWAIHHANRQGFTGGEELVRQYGDFQRRALANPATRKAAAPYYLAVGESNPEKWYTTLEECFAVTGPVESFAATYGIDARLMLLLAKELGMPVTGDDGVDLVAWLEAEPGMMDRLTGNLGFGPGWYLEGA